MKLAGGQSYTAVVGSMLLIAFSQSFCMSPEIHIEMGYDYEGYNTFKLGPSLFWPGDGFYFESLKNNSFSLTSALTASLKPFNQPLYGFSFIAEDGWNGVLISGAFSVLPYGRLNYWRYYGSIGGGLTFGDIINLGVNLNVPFNQTIKEFPMTRLKASISYKWNVLGL